MQRIENGIDEEFLMIKMSYYKMQMLKIAEMFVSNILLEMDFFNMDLREISEKDSEIEMAALNEVLSMNKSQKEIDFYELFFFFYFFFIHYGNR